MTPVRASAPGKMFLLGEYAVLRGNPALVTAVDRRARVQLAGDTGETRVSAAELGLSRAALSDDARLALVERCLGRHHGHVTIDTAGFVEVDQKLGLGSSAALCAALSVAIGESVEFAIAAHRAAQDGGSGADVVTSFHGGTLLCATGKGALSADPVDLPGDLEVLAVWTGHSASTRDLVRCVLDSGASFADLAAATEMGLQSTDASGFMAAVDSFYTALESLEANSGAPIVSTGHAELATLARSTGAAYKPSGAGGGDIGLVFCRRDDAPRVRSSLDAAGVAIVDLKIGADGARID